MPIAISSLFTTYLIYPILGVVMVFVAALVAKKNGLTKNKRMMTYSLISVLILSIPALLGFLDYNFMPYAYMASAGVYVLLGVLNQKLLPWVFKDEKLKYRVKIIYTSFLTIVSICLFVMVFNLCNEFKFGLWASTALIPFVLPSLLMQSYHLFINIPTPIYKIWEYGMNPGSQALEEIDHKKLKVVRVELFKREEDKEPTRINTKFPEEMVFGDWIQLMIDDYNKQWSHSPIKTSGKNGSGWIFYVKPWVLAPRRYLDPELTLKGNRIKESHLIVCKRVENTSIV